MGMNPATSIPRFSALRCLALVGSLSAAALALPTVASAQVSLPFTDTFATDTRTINYKVSAGRTNFGYSSADQRLTLSATTEATYAFTLKDTIGNFQSRSSYTVSMDFLTASTFTGATGVNMAAVGIASADNQVFSNVANTSFEVTARMTAATGATIFRVRANGGSTGEQTSASFTLETDTWYRLSTTFQQTALNTFRIDSEIFKFNAIDSTWTSLSTFSVASFTNTSISPTTNLFAGFAAYRHSTGRGTAAVDNFSVIPEPSSAAALFGVMALASVGLRRRRRAA